MGFVNLHVHTKYSMLDGMGKINELVSRAKEMGQNALAITDHARCHGWIHFYKECKKQDIKPIIGVEAYVSPDRLLKTSDNREGYHLVLLAKDQEGYKNLLKIISDSELVGFYYRPNTDITVLEKYGKGIIALSACLAGEIPKLLMSDKYEEAKKLALRYNEIFDEFYLELQANNTVDQLRCNHLLIELHKDTGIPLVVTNDTHYTFKEDAWAHEVLLAIQTSAVIEEEVLLSKGSFNVDNPETNPTDTYLDKHSSDFPDAMQDESDDDTNKKTKKKAKKKKERFKFDSPNYWLKSEEEVREFLPDYDGLLDEAIENTQRIADKCCVEFEFGENKLPHVEVPGGMTSHEYLSKKCYDALYDFCERTNYEIDCAKYYDRLEYELSILKKHDVSDYFLIDEDIIRYARDNGILTGPGRGSASGSLVSYLLGITRIDPLGYNTNVELMFERFLSPERKELPDIDTDLEPERRKDVMRYLREKYGSKRVVQIATFGKMGAKTVIKDVGRALGKDFDTLNEITKLIPASIEDHETGDVMSNFTLSDLIEEKDVNGNYTPSALALQELRNNEPELFKIAERLEGIPRQTGIHAGGVVISPVDLDELIPMMRSTDDMSATQFDMDTIAELGLIKYDLLGLKTLSIIGNSFNLIKRYEGLDINPDELDLTDEKVYKLLSEGDTLGVFQVESDMFRNLLIQMKPSNFADITAALALGRPGPLDSGMDQVYIRNKHGYSRIEYPHEDLEEIMSDTHGIFLYQEQLMLTCMKLAGFSALEADLMRKAVGKKDQDLIREIGQQFVSRAVERGYDTRMLEDLWHNMATFGQYGLRKC